MRAHRLGRGPTYRGATSGQLFDAALDMPMGMGATLLDQTIGGAVQSYGLGTAIRSSRTPEGNIEALPEPERIQRQSGTLPNPVASGRALLERFGVIDRPEPTAPSLTQDAWETSPFFRENIPWDAAMTEDRAAALATQYDVRAVRDYFGAKRPFSSFIGNLAGQALDPINYIPIAGPAVRAANVARFGYVRGTAATASLDAAANTAVFGIATGDARRRFGDDVSWQATVSEIATAALIGGAFGTVAGVLGRRSFEGLERARADQEQRLSTLQTTQEARIALNEAVAGLVHDGEVRLSPNATEPMARIAGEVEQLSRAYDTVKDTPSGDPRDPLVAITPEDIEGTIVARGAFKDINELEFSKRGFGLVKIIWGHGDRSAEPPEFQVVKEDVTDFPNVIRQYEPSSVSKDGLRREWRVRRGDRVVVYADTMMGEKGRHLVTAYVARTPDEMNAPVSRERPAALPGSAPQAGNLVGDTAEGRSIGDLGAGQSLPATRNIGQRIAIDNTPPTPEAAPEGRLEAGERIARADDYRAIAQQYRVDPETGSFIEEAELQQLEAEGRLTDDDRIELDVATRGYEDGAAYGEALRAAVACMV